MKIAPPLRRSTAQRGRQGFEVIIPAKRNFLLMLFLAAWLVGWSFGEVFAIRELFSEKTEAPDLFLVVWLLIWTLGGGFAIYIWLWMAKGREVIILRPDTLAIRRDVLGLERTREYDLSYTRNLSLSPVTWNPYDSSAAMSFWGVGGGLITFDYGARTFRFGASVDESEARDIISELKAIHAFSETT